LTGWAGGPKADALSTQSPAQLEKLALTILQRIFGAASLRKQLLSSHSYNWANDPHIRGAYSYIPVNGLDLPKTLAAPVEGTLFFAGEATVADAQTGTVFGALESGLRAAREILGIKTAAKRQ
jgi:monoamine oxidase